MAILVNKDELKGINFFNSFIEKARKGEQVGGSYIYRENIAERTSTNGQVIRYKYYYVSDMLKDSAEKLLQNIGKWFFKGSKESVAKISKTYETENIAKSYGADKKTWYQHIMEYFSHKSIWDKRFSSKENQEKFKKPIKQKVAEKVEVKGMETTAEKPAEIKTSVVKKEQKIKTWKPNPSLMRKIWSLYAGKEVEKEEKKEKLAEKFIAKKDGLLENDNEKIESNDIINNVGVIENGENQSGIEQTRLSESIENLRSGNSERNSNQYGDETKQGSNGNGTLLSVDESGNGSRISDNINVGRGRITKSQAKEIRKQCKEILKKPDSEITEQDKAVLSQYVGAGGTGEDDSSNSGVLYEFYTPRNVISKVWQIVDKYNSNQNKSVIEPSSGIGRFAEGRNEDFTMFELEEESARIAHLLHPKAEIVQGAFQENFMKNKDGRFAKKDFKKFDVAVGNPPYGAYTGKYKGLGEGKDYKRYETYFMSRTLDTLKDDGIMAMVVPSGFMDGKTSYGKDLEKIAEKGELLEAWRLPNGTFDSTDVGTDIVVFKKGKGGSVEQIKSYFEKNPSHIVGDIATRTNRFGKEESYIKPKDGQTFGSAVESINVESTKINENIKNLSNEIKVTEKKETRDPQKITSKTKFDDYVKTEKGNGVVTGYLKKNNKISGVIVKTDSGERVECNFDIKESETEKHTNRSKAMKGNQNAIGEHEYPLNSNAHKMDVAEFNQKYGKLFDEKDIPIWKATNKYGNIDITKLEKNNIEYLQKSDHFVKEGDTFINVVNYASGNIREKLKNLDKNDEQYEYKKALLEAVLPEKKELSQITLSPISDWVREYKTNEGKTLIDSFFDWMYGDPSPIPREEIPAELNYGDIKDFIHKIPLKLDRGEAGTDDKKSVERYRQRKKQLRRETAIKLFNRFLQEGLSIENQKELTEKWNEKANSFVNPDYKKIPVFVDGMSTHKGSKEFTLTDQQLKGISMLVNKGTGLLAYDVGVGKTACGIVATVNQIQTGRAKKPLICVPKSVYTNWIESIHEFFPDIKVNELGNLSKNYWKDGMKIENGSISVCTYEGLENIGFNEEEEAEIAQDTEFAAFTNTDEKQTKRKQALRTEKIAESVGGMSKTRDEGVQFSDLGFDHITVDEVHNFRNLFKMPRKVKKNKDDVDKIESNEFDGLGAGGEPSNRAKKLFAVTQLIQRHNEGRNTFLLSATPFQNSPTEIYSILSYMARDKLKELGYYSLEEFVTNFCKVQRDYIVKANRITEANVVKGFENLGELQNLLQGYMDKVDGEEAGVIRPYKRMHHPELEMSDLQKEIIGECESYIEIQEKLPKKERDDGYMFRAMNAMKNCALSPVLVDPEFIPEGSKILRDKFVESSPKLKFVCDSIIAQYKKNSHNGQIMYMPLGVEFFPKVKDYLIKHGLPKEAIATIAGGATTDKAMDARDELFKEFNDVDGKCKVIIGSSTIKEGCNLQGNTTSIYCCQLDWNPTDVQQLWGRGWRQGNKQGIVHCITPLMHDSLDPMIFEKHDEKSSRTDDLYSYKGDSMNAKDVDPEELKFALIKDPAKRADMKVMEYKEKAESDYRMYGQLIDVLHSRIDIAFESDDSIENNAFNRIRYYGYKSIKEIQDRIADEKKKVTKLNSLIKNLSKYKDNPEGWNNDYAKIKEDINAAKIIYYPTYTQYSYNEAINYLESSKKDFEDKNIERQSLVRIVNTEQKKMKDKREACKKYLESKGLNTEADCQAKIQDYVKLMDEAKEHSDKAKEMREQFYAEAVQYNEDHKKELLSVSELVKLNVDSIMNDLHPMDAEWKAKIKAENDARFNKSLPIFFAMGDRFYIKKSFC